MDLRKLKKLIELLEESGLAEIEIKQGEETVRISRQASVPAGTHSVGNIHMPTPMMPTQAPAAPTAIPVAHPETKKIEEPTGHTVKSPMVGTAYLAPTPGAKPFVDVGQHVKEGDILCMVEAMKMFNQIEADKSGILSARLIENEQPVEYGQPLFIIE
jgi:acetyl-CoA carboxylase biotin carboxyl carrier protein